MCRAEFGPYDLRHPLSASSLGLGFLDALGILQRQLAVSEKRGTPKSSILIGFSIMKPSILGYHYFRKHPTDQIAKWF